MAPTQPDASASQPEKAATQTSTSDASSGEVTAEGPGKRKKPDKKEPPSLKATLIVLGIVFLFLNPSVRWRLAEFNLWVRSSLPYGGNPLLGISIGGTQADMVTIEARFGVNSELMSGSFFLMKEKVNGRYAWYKNAPGREAYLLWDSCSAWLISRFPDGNAPNCEGWSYTGRCYGMPWECAKTWMVREDGRWDKAGDSVTVSAFYGEQAQAQAEPSKCSEEEESELLENFAKFDIVIPWINGSHPQWLADRAATCEDWQWQEMWLDAVTRSPGTQECLKDQQSINEATAFMAKGGCEDGANGQEGACAWKSLKQAPRGLTTRSGRCFRQFVDAHCTGRLTSIKDHDELRYLMRSIEQHLPWHNGRILLVTANKTVPHWLKPGGRLEVLQQDDLLQAAMSSEKFVNAVDRGRNAEWAPDRIFNDFPLQAALPFIPKVSRVVMLLQDDLLFARKASICDFFRHRNGVRLFARPFEGIGNRDPYSHIYESIEHSSFRFFNLYSRSKDRKPKDYFRGLHLPDMLDTKLLDKLWTDHGDVMSDAVSSSFRHPNLTNVVGLHHSEAARQRRNAESGISQLEDTDLELHIDNAALNTSGPGPISKRPWMEVVLESLDDWRYKMAKLPPVPSQLPGIIGFQDNLGADSKDTVAELDCLREKWLGKLLPTPSSWENPESSPSLCRYWEGSPRSKGKKAGSQRKEKEAQKAEL